MSDLAGLLCGHGQSAGFARRAARLSVSVRETWRVRALVAAFAERGVTPTVVVAEEERPVVRTAFRTDLLPLAAAWTRDAAKAVPPGLTLYGATIRMWALAAGHWLDGGYVLDLDPEAPDTHEQLADALVRCGLPATLLGVRGGGPGLRVTGRRRLGRLVELVGPAPSDAAEPHWPATDLMRVAT